MSSVTEPFLPDNFFPPDVSSIFVHQDYDVLESLKLHTSELVLANTFKSLNRQKSFLLGRKAALLALIKIGVAAPVLRGSSDEPIWPDGVIGSIAHSREFAICVVTKSDSFRGIGIDLECSDNNFNLNIAKRICTASEIENLPNDEIERADRLLKIFSAKEAYYKAVFPTLKKFLGFRDVELIWDDDNFEGRIVNPRFTEKKTASGKVGKGSCLVSVCYEMK